MTSRQPAKGTIRPEHALCYTEQVLLTGSVKGAHVNATDVLGIVLASLMIVLALAALYAVRAAVLAMRDVRSAVMEVRDRLVPLLVKADVTVDAVNVELLRLDQIVTQVEEVGDAVSVAGEFIRSPVNSAAYRIAKFARGLKRSGRTPSTQSREDA